MLTAPLVAPLTRLDKELCHEALSLFKLVGGRAQSEEEELSWKEGDRQPPPHSALTDPALHG